MNRTDSRRTLSTLLAVAIAILLAAPAAAQKGATPIWEPTDITKPGHYVLTRNLSGALAIGGRLNVVDILASDVTLDLNGFEIAAADAAQCDDCSAIRARNVERVVIQNGQIDVANDLGISLEGVSSYVIRDLRIACSRPIAGGILVGLGSSHGHIADNLVRCRNGINVGSGEVVVEDNAVSGASSIGIQLSSSADGSIIRGNQLRGGGLGLTVDTDRNLIEDNLITGFDTGLVLGFESNDNLMRGNVSRGNTTDFSDTGTDNTSAGDNYLPALQ